MFPNELIIIAQSIKVHLGHLMQPGAGTIVYSPYPLRARSEDDGNFLWCALTRTGECTDIGEAVIMSRRKYQENARASVNRKYKDTLFGALFGDISNRNAIIDLHNVLNHSHYDHDAPLQIVTIQDVAYLNMRNDSAFLIGNEILSLWEEQSTYNPNMPFRGLIYLAEEYKGLYARGNHDIYGPALIKLPTPKYVFFYAGGESEPNEEMHLSDAFEDPKGGCLEMTATVINITNPENVHIMEGCRLLREYTYLIRTVQRNKDAGMTNEASVTAAVDECIEKGMLRDYLLKNKAEVTHMILNEYNEKQHYENVANYYEQKGLAQGEKEGKLHLLYELVTSRELPLATAVKRAELIGVKDEKDFRAKAKEAGFNLSEIH